MGKKANRKRERNRVEKEMDSIQRPNPPKRSAEGRRIQDMERRLDELKAQHPDDVTDYGTAEVEIPVGFEQDKELVCDFCSSKKVEWFYPARPVEYLASLSQGAWSACAPCSRLIEGHDDDGLVERALQHREFSSMPQRDQIVVRDQIKLMQDAFREARTGDRLTPQQQAMEELAIKSPAAALGMQMFTGMGMGTDSCQFCGDPQPVWNLVVRGEKGPEDWPACWTCADSFKKDEWDFLTDRALRRKFGNMEDIVGKPMGEEHKRNALRQMYTWVKENMVGRYMHPQFPNPTLLAEEYPDEHATKESLMGSEAAALAHAYGGPVTLVGELPLRPKWANARSFNKTWDSLLKDQPRASDPPNYIKPGMMFSNYAFGQMIDAHLCVVEPEQVDMIEDMPFPELWRYALDTKAPWDPMYLDFEGYGGKVPTVTCLHGDAKIYGAVVWQPHDFHAGINLAIAPIGGAEYIKEHVGWNFDPQGNPVMGGAWDTTTTQPKPPWFEYVVMGIGAFGGDIKGSSVNGTDTGIFPVESAVSGLYIPHAGVETFKATSPDPEWDEGSYPGAMMTSNTWVAHDHKTTDFTDFANQVAEHADMVMRMCCKVLQTMFFMDNAPVEISAERVSRQVRRQAERQGGRVGDIVLVRGKKARTKDEAQGEHGTANYSYRFLRRGHFRHLGSDAALASRPDLVTPCTRIGDAQCPHGECRKIWIDPVIVGDENLPYKAKSHQLKAMKKDKS